MWWYVRTTLKWLGIVVASLMFGASLALSCDRVYHKYHHHSTSYVFRVSPQFTQEQQASLRKAFDAWEVNGRFHINSRVGECPTKPDEVDACFIPVNQITECLPDAKTAAGCTRVVDNYVQVSIDTDCGTSQTFYWLAAHETGHVLGIGHIDVPDSIMYPNVSCQK